MKLKSRKEQRIHAELGLIIDAFGQAMWNANKEYIGKQPACSHENGIRFTPSMWRAWNKYVDFCARYPND